MVVPDHDALLGQAKLLAVWVWSPYLVLYHVVVEASSKCVLVRASVVGQFYFA